MARSFRIVCDPGQIPLVEALLRSQDFDFEPEPFSAWCRRLTAEPFPLGASLASRFGLIYIQDRSSMLPPLALDPPPGAVVLDMCASPGGKTSFLAQLAGRSGMVLGNEASAARLATLRQNLAQLCLPQALSCGYPGQDLPVPDGCLRHLLLDPPCSGWGTARKNPHVLTLWHEDNVDRLTGLQRQLLAKAASLLAPGGRMVYSTCTTNQAENEDQVDWAVAELGLEVLELAPFPGFAFHEPLTPGARGTLRVDEEGSDAQGFYIALLRKPGPEASGPEAAVSAPSAAGAFDPREAFGGPNVAWEEPLAWDNLPPGVLESFKDDACFVPLAGRHLLPARYKGQRLGAVKGGRFRPWARARVLAPPVGSGPQLDAREPRPLLDLLEGRAVAAAPGCGRMALYFRGLPLGFLTVKGARALWSDR